MRYLVVLSSSEGQVRLNFKPTQEAAKTVYDALFAAEREKESSDTPSYLALYRLPDNLGEFEVSVDTTQNVGVEIQYGITLWDQEFGCGEDNEDGDDEEQEQE